MSRERITENKPQRPTRVPLQEQRNKLTVEGRDPNRVYRWVNDVDDRIAKFKMAGYIVEEAKNVKVGDPSLETGQSTTSSIVEKNVGGRIKAILMSQDKEDYEADQKAKQREVEELEAAMHRDNQAASDYGNVEMHRRRLP
jgi:hypothetical protein